LINFPIMKRFIDLLLAELSTLFFVRLEIMLKKLIKEPSLEMTTKNCKNILETIRINHVKKLVISCVCSTRIEKKQTMMMTWVNRL
jgi:hypothetical protein